ncbi:glycosyltransferase family 2 protein, partial [Escherichia coli]|nr:glycosyltransferase family 2 protein [Escherichia coli]
KCLPVNLKNINEISHEINALSQDNMVIKYKSNILIRFANKIINKVKCYFCLISSGNDVAIKKVNRYFDN